MPNRLLLGSGHCQAEGREVLLSIPARYASRAANRHCLAEHGIVAAQGPANVKPLADAIDGIKTLLPAIGGFYLLWHGF